ncbi:hypothetical protein PanWU01x14_354420 [Parasponia andersonii]|uniref:Uncharacterized protein n=1 Tax=Parasponia andersonii TaxID=3476 RepID=A0A2P5A9M8_PARAD|nr:hypothetical protein PanWU01x14_354420 [Parasponia andersonii]
MGPSSNSGTAMRDYRPDGRASPIAKIVREHQEQLLEELWLALYGETLKCTAPDYAKMISLIVLPLWRLHLPHMPHMFSGGL